MTQKSVKKKIPLWLYPEEIEMLDIYVKESVSKSRNQFISQAIDFYAGYLRTIEKNQFLPRAIESSLHGIVDASEDRIAKLLFKLSVELSMTMNVLASTAEIDEMTLRKLRAKCVSDVRKTVGKIDFEGIVKYQNRGF